jgi:hypothetical protein
MGNRISKGVCLETGELGIWVPSGEGFSITSLKQREAYKSKLERERNGRGPGFTFTAMDEIPEVIELLDEKDCGRLLFLQCFVDYENNRLVRGSGKSKTGMTERDIREALSIGDDFGRFFADMLRYGIIIPNDDGSYSINNRYHFRGRLTKNPRVIRSFTAKVKELYHKYDPRDLGFIYKLLPYVHYELNTLCRSPHEQELDKIEALTKKEISLITGRDESTTFRKLRRLQFDGMYVFAQVIRGKEKFYKLNPFIFYRLDGYPDATLSAIFLVKNRK